MEFIVYTILSINCNIWKGDIRNCFTFSNRKLYKKRENRCIVFINLEDMLGEKIEIISRLLENVILNFGENVVTLELKYLVVFIIVLR